MVSVYIRLSLATVAFVLSAIAQPTTQAFSDTRTGTPAAQSSTQAARQTTLSPEMRGDIFMARKMYREAIEAYAEGPKDSSVLVNKTGIAYHQLLEMAQARRLYERAIKLDPKYSEAINNLGTV